MWLEQKANNLAASRRRLRQRLMEARSVLHRDVQKKFGPGVFDFENKRLIGDNGFSLVWLLRHHPDKPVSYENQQTSVGVVVLRHEIPEKSDGTDIR